MSVNTTSRTPWWASTVTRTTLVFTLFLLGATLTTGYLVFNGSRKQLEVAAQDDMGHALDLATIRMEHFAGSLSDDIDLMTDNDAVRRYLAAVDTSEAGPGSEPFQRITFLLESFIKTRRNYAQVRFIEADEVGMERIRFDREQGGVNRIADSLLQAKGDRDYFQATMQLPPGGRYFSPIDLNKEHGTLSRPLMPTLRAAAPLHTPSGKAIGMLIINADLGGLFAELASIQGPRGRLVLVDANDELLLHPDTSRMFRTEFGASWTLADELGVADPPMEEVFRTNGRMVLLRPVHLPIMDRSYRVGITVNTDHMLAGLRQQRRLSLIYAIAIGGGFLLLTLLYALHNRRRLDDLTRRIELFAKGERDAVLPVERMDEIGRLSRSLGHMQERIDQRVRELEVARSKAEEADRLKQEFLANMSHEVRTPLNAIVGMSEALEAADLSDADREKLGVVQRSAQRLRGLVDDLLMHARIAEGRLQVTVEAVDLRTLVGDIAQAHLPMASAKGLALRTHFHGVTDTVPTDPLRLHQIIDNLVTNAVKFTVQGQVDIRVEHVQGEGDELLRIQVNDTGPGIPEEAQRRVFERFERAVEADNDRSGAGLGLAITHRLVDLLGGRITMRSTAGIGSTFTVELPIDRQLPTRTGAVTVVDPATVKGLRVLYVEDVATNRQLLAYWAEAWDWRSEMAASAAEALTLCDGRPFDLVLMDMDLGEGMRGSELALRIRGLARYRYTPMLAVTAYVDEGAMNEALLAGINDRITKPIDKGELLAKAAFWTGRAGGDCEGRVDTGPLEAQYDGEAEALLRVLQQYRREFQRHRTELLKAMESRDDAALAAVRHKLAPHFQLLGLHDALLALDTIDGMSAGEVETLFRCCERAFLLRQQALQAGI